MEFQELKDCRFDGSGRFKLGDYPTDVHVEKKLKPHFEALTEANTQRMAQLQDKLYAEGREGVVVILQAMDAAGKDSTIKHVMSGINPQGVSVASFKQPSSEELAHDFLWRAVTRLPRRGCIGLFNRSYYEDVLVVRVHDLQKTYRMPKRVLDTPKDDFFEQRYRQIRDFERYLWENGYRVLKVFLDVSRAEQRRRFLDRIDDESKNWKFSSSDVAERELWPKYMDAYEQCIDRTATREAPWYVIPADQKFYARWLVSEAMAHVLEECDPHYPELPAEQRDDLTAARTKLLAETGGRDDRVERDETERDETERENG